VETYWAAPAAARDHVAALGRPSTVCVPVGSARIARGGAQQQGDHDASITPIAGCQPDFGSQSIVGCTDCPSEKHSLPRISRMMKRSAASPAATGLSPTREEELSSGHKGSLGAKRATQLLERPPPSGRPPCARPV
jgi:hypothetical protein